MSRDYSVSLTFKTQGAAASAQDVEKIDKAMVAAAEAARKMAQDASGALNATGLSAKQTAWALRNVPAQFTDIATQIAAGQNPMQVLIQQGGQLKDMFGGIGPAAKALGGYVASLISPLNLTLAAAGALGYALYKASNEAESLHRAIIAGNGAIGSFSQLAEAARIAATASGGSRGDALDTVAKLVEGGRVAAQNLHLAAEAALRLDRAGVQAAEDTVAAFEALGKKPVEALAALNAKWNFLTAETRAQVIALQEQGRTAEAALVAQQTYAEAGITISKRLEERLGYVGRAWRFVKEETAGAIEAVMSIGRQKSAAEAVAAARGEVAKLEADVRHLKATGDSVAAFGYEVDLGKARDKLKAAEAVLAEETRTAQAQAGAAAEKALAERSAAEGKAWDALARTRAQQREAEIEDLRKHYTRQTVMAGADQNVQLRLAAEYLEKLNVIQAKYADKSIAKAGAAEAAALKRMQELGLKNELDAYYETGGEETMRLTAEKRAAQDLAAAYRDVTKAADDRMQRARALYDATPQGRYDTFADNLAFAEQMATAGKITQDQLDAITASLFEVKAAGKDTADELVRAFEGWGKSASKAFVDFAVTGKGSFKDLAHSMLAEVAQMAAYQNIFKPLFGNLGEMFKGFKFAEGGIMSAAGPLPLRRYSSGGIASSPQLAMFGEGSVPEAYVPVPSGKIPVELKGGGAPNVQFVLVNRSGTELKARQQGPARLDSGRWVVNVMMDALESDPGLRSAIGGIR